MKYKEGDRVIVSTNKGKVSGIVMPSKRTVVIKLESGYNMGIKKSNVKGLKVVRRAMPVKKKGKNVGFKKGLPAVVILSTGGTISSRVDYSTGAVHASLDASDLVEAVPELKDIANIECKGILNKMSEDIKPGDWVKIAKAVYREVKRKDVSGVVVTHGTDTMHYTSAALSFMLEDLNKPVVLTGSQRSSDRGSSDARMNLICSAIAATSDIAEVVVCMHGTTDDAYCSVHRGTKVRKMHTSRRDAFQSINEGQIAMIRPDGKIERTNKYRKRSERVVKLRIGIESQVALVYVHPGMNPDLIDWYVKKGYKGLVLMATGLGHVPSELLRGIKNAVKRGVTVCLAPQCISGRLNPLVYSNGRKLIKAGALPLEDMLPETAYVKLMWSLGQDKPKLMLENLRGEIVECIDPEVFESS
jgi:glutamyl-tRNA(Gln) amidotransferase subunit D